MPEFMIVMSIWSEVTILHQILIFVSPHVMLGLHVLR